MPAVPILDYYSDLRSRLLEDADPDLLAARRRARHSARCCPDCGFPRSSHAPCCPGAEPADDETTPDPA